jgi:GNAT superfamily N-acetyltransferase
MSGPARYETDDDPDRLDRDMIWDFLHSQAYWGTWRTREQLDRQIESAWRNVGVYATTGQVGYARVVSDGVALAYLADVFVLPAQRGAGLGRALVAACVEHPGSVRFRWLLHTRDAHDLYRSFGFGPAPDSLMERG